MASVGTSLSGWCLKPYSEFSKREHDGCPANFATGGTCPCDCGHAGGRARADTQDDSRWWAGIPAGKEKAPRARAGTGVDKTAQPVYAERVPTTGGVEALQALHKGAHHEAAEQEAVDAGEPEPSS